jgi:hypothetical protein
MTAQNRDANKAVFEQGDRPQGSDYVNLIDSFLSLVDVSAQTVISDLSVPNVTVATELSASNISCSAMTLKSFVAASVQSTVLTTAQTSAVFNSLGQGDHKVVSLMRVNINSTTVALMYTNVGTYF